MSEPTENKDSGQILSPESELDESTGLPESIPTVPDFAVSEPEYDLRKRCFTVEAEDGSEWDFDPALKRWKQDITVKMD